MPTQGCSRQAIHGLLAHGPHPCVPPYGSAFDRQSGKADQNRGNGNGKNGDSRNSNSLTASAIATAELHVGKAAQSRAPQRQPGAYTHRATANATKAP
jgi:hypothetical protein